MVGAPVRSDSAGRPRHAVVAGAWVQKDARAPRSPISFMMASVSCPMSARPVGKMG